jgi:hypothetical protein
MATGEEDVLRFDVAVDHAVPMGHGQRFGDLSEKADGFRNGKFSGTGEPFPERLALHIGHDVVEESFSLSRVEQAEDVRVLQAGGDFDFAGESLGPHRRSKIGAEHLDRDVPAVTEILGEIDCGHATLAEFSLQAVTVGECCGKARVDGQGLVVDGRWSMVDGTGS